jgi:uncharacterized protein YegP (UPF0339 family)
VSKYEPYFELCRGDAGWFSRVRGGNGHKVWTSEVYTRKEAALNAFRVLGDTFGCSKARAYAPMDPGSSLAGYLHVPTREDDQTVAWLALPIRYVDERTS